MKPKGVLGEPMADATLLEVTGLAVRRGTQDVFTDFDLAISSGQSILLHGENGAGKTTLIEAIAGLLPLHAGDISRARPYGLALQHGGFHGDEIVHERIEAAASLAGVDAAGVDAILERWGLTHRRADRIAHLSGGMQRRIGLIQALLPAYADAAPRLILLDEPSEGLDQAGMAVLSRDVRALAARGHAFLIASHDARLDEIATHTLDLADPTLRASDAATGEIAEDVPCLAAGETRMRDAETWMRLDRRTHASLVVRGLPFLAALITISGLTSALDLSRLPTSLAGGLVMLPAFLAALPPHTSLRLARENRSGDWWRAMGGCDSAPEPFSAILLLLGPWVAALVLGLATVQDWHWLGYGLAMMCVNLAAGAIGTLVERLPRQQAAFGTLLNLILLWPFLILADGISMDPIWQPMLVAGLPPLIIAFAMPLLHPRTGSD